jgi:hypothetical protein
LTEGIDALGEVTAIAANADDKRLFGGYGADNDIIVASVKASGRAQPYGGRHGAGDRKPEGSVNSRRQSERVRL